MNSKLQLIDFRESPTVQTKIIKGAPTSIAWLPNDTFGCAIGHDDGNVDLFSFQSNSVVITQNVSENAISGISFCETRNNVASFTSDNLILFSTLPVWGFGKFSVSKTYPMHTSNVTSANWFPRSDGNPMFISCDMDSMVHIFEVPNEYIPIYGT
ncbi:hypothetical protein GPJ56_010179 [Histomonas meleagridis]|uniref:uncharacterized protein n=1 Tax=Histomonas meleagridis TaxID=135588 RepID=UPI003559EF07|nr:hypothetical protein GPJ56_010179 [Histomonas meleagridis]KAH0804715.1 hypothetical protein GO595_002409 [Histomonas meleagridis]